MNPWTACFQPVFGASGTHSSNGGGTLSYVLFYVWTFMLNFLFLCSLWFFFFCVSLVVLFRIVFLWLSPLVFSCSLINPHVFKIWFPYVSLSAVVCVVQILVPWNRFMFWILCFSCSLLNICIWIHCFLLLSWTCLLQECSFMFDLLRILGLFGIDE